MKSTKKHFEIVPRPIQFQRKSSYAELKENLKTTFFPNGKNFCGKISKMHSKLGNAKGDTIEDNPAFTLGSFVDSCTSQKPRIYLLTKTQLATFESESSDSDFSLPDLGFEYTALNSTQHTVPNPLHTVATAAVGAPTESLLSPAVQGSVTIETSTPMRFATSSAESSATSDFRDAGTPTVSLRIPESTLKTCCICYERQKNAFFIPCGHTSCMVCGVQLQSSGKNCHQCKAKIQMVNSIFD